MPAFAGSPAVQAMARIRPAGDGPECLKAHAIGTGPVRGPDQLRRGADGLRPRLARAEHSLLAGSRVSHVSAPADHGPLAGDAALIQVLGAGRVSIAAGSACRRADGESPVRHPAASSQRPSRPAHLVIRTLAVRIPVPGGHARLGRGTPMADGGAGGTHRPGAASVLGHAGIGLVSDVGPGRPGDLASIVPPGLLGGIPPPGCAAAGAGGPGLAAGPSARGCKACGDIGGSGGPLGCGDRASLPGRPARYRVIWLVCARCGATTSRLFYDERDLPVCAGSADAPHGPMELQR